MYSINGVALANPTYGWRLKLAGTTPQAPLARTLQDFNAAGRDGTIQVRGFTATPTITLVVTTPAANLEALRALFLYGTTLTFTADSSKTLNVELVSLTPDIITLAGNQVHRLTVVLRCPDVYWRDLSTSDYGPTTVTNGAGQTVMVLTASTGPVRDALVCIKGGISNPQIAGANGTYLNWTGTLDASTYLTFDTWSGRAWTGAAAFAETTEVTSKVGNGRGPYFLELAGSTNPAVNGLPLVITGTSLASSPTVTVRGRNAYNR